MSAIKMRASSHFLNYLAKRGIIQLCWQGFLFPADCGFCSSTLRSLKSLSQMYVKMMGNRKGKMLLRHDKKTSHHHCSPLWFRSGLMSVEQEPPKRKTEQCIGCKSRPLSPTITSFQQLSSGDLLAECHRSVGLRKAVRVSPLKPSYLFCSWQWKYLAQLVIAWC